MKGLWTIFRAMLSKINLEISYSLEHKKENTKEDESNRGQVVNVYVENSVNESVKKVGKIIILSKIIDIYADELAKGIIVKAEFANGTPASFTEIECSIEELYGPVIKRTDQNGIITFGDIGIKEAGNYKICIKGMERVIYEDLVIKNNPINLKFISQPQDVSSKEVLKEVLVQAIYQSGTIAPNVYVEININKEGVKWEGTRRKCTDKHGIAHFDDLVFTKTGNYKLKAMHKHIFLYSKPFHVFAPGVCMDFEKCDAGSKEEVEAFLTALLEKQSEGDVIKYNGEEY